MTRHLGASLLVIAAVGACGPAATTPETPPGGTDLQVAGGTNEEGASDAAAQRYDTSPVKEPGELLLHLRWKDPGATISTAAEFANLPPAFVNSNLRSVVRDALDEIIADDVHAEKMAQVVDLDAPIDLVGVADTSRSVPVPEPMMAWSIGLTSLDAGLAASKGKPAPLGPGVWRIGTDNRWGAKCAISAAAGKSPARLVCAERKRHIEALAPYVARNVAALPESEGDFRASLNLRPVLDKYGRTWSNQARGLPILAKELENGVPKFDQAIMDIADALAIEAGALIHDADSVHVSLTMDRAKGIVGQLEMQFADATSWTVQTIVDGADKKGPAPDLFWHLPADSETVTYGRAGDPKRWEPIMKTLQDLLEGALEGEKIGTPGDRNAIASLLRLPASQYAASVGANGHFDAAAPAGATITGVVDSTVGWHVVGIDDDTKEMKAWLTDAVKAYNRPTLQRLIKKELGPDAKNLPVVRQTRAPRELGPGGLHIEVTIPDVEDPMEALVAGPGAPPPPGGRAKAKTVDLKFHLMLMGDSGRTWIGFASNDRELAKLMGSLKGTEPGSKSLATRSSLSRFKSERHNAVSVTSLEGFLGALRPVIEGLSPIAAAAGAGGPAQKMMDALEKLPNRGQTPIVSVADVTTGDKPKLEVKMTVAKGTLEDLGYLVQQALTIAGSQP